MQNFYQKRLAESEEIHYFMRQHTLPYGLSDFDMVSQWRSLWGK